jgi:hypothetical protein
VSKHVLRAALVWHDEVMSDIVVDKSAKLTIGTSPRATFLVPDLGLPDELVILRPGARGYVLTLGDRMGGTIAIGGSERDVGAFVRESGDRFHATSIERGDWGLVELDPSGAYKLFFQFVEVDERVPVVKRSMVLAGLGGHLFATAVLALVWYLQGQELDEAVFRGAAITTIALVIGGVAWAILRDDSESKASLAFSTVLHAALLFATYQVYDESDAFAWPERPPLADRYIVGRIEPTPPPAITATQPTAQPELPAPAPPSPSPVPQPSAAPGTRAPGHAPEVGVLQRRNRDILDGVLGRSTAGTLSHFNEIGGDGLPGTGGDGGLPGTHGHGRDGNGQGPVGKFTRDPGGPPGPPHEDRKGGCMGDDCKGPSEKQVGTIIINPPTVDDELDKKTIDQIVRSRSGLFRSCYQRQLDHGHPDLGGDIVTKFVIGGDGAVKSAVVIGGTLHNEDVAACVTRNLMTLPFPPKPPGGIAIYPFMFSPH